MKRAAWVRYWKDPVPQFKPPPRPPKQAVFAFIEPAEESRRPSKRRPR